MELALALDTLSWVTIPSCKSIERNSAWDKAGITPNLRSKFFGQARERVKGRWWVGEVGGGELRELAEKAFGSTRTIVLNWIRVFGNHP